MASREGLCPCLSQTNDSIVFCQKPEGHDGLHEWRDPVHPTHTKHWGGNVTTIVTDTRFRTESPRAMARRLGLVTTSSGGVAYAPMTPTQQDVDEAASVELIHGGGGEN
jgi:hypothetical protein